jgi:hypothetical protein
MGAQPGLPGSQFQGEDFILRAIKDLQRDLQQMTAANVLGTAGIGVIPNGVTVNGQMQFKRADGTLGVSVDPTNGTFVAYDAAGANPVARFGALVVTNPGSYGVEVLVGGTWVQIGAQTTTWGTISGIPSAYNTVNQKWAPDAHTHPGTDVTSRVAAATDAIGSQSGWTNNVGGTSYYALWVGNDATYSLGKNTSSIRYKINVTSHYTDPANVLKLVPVTYQRTASGTTEFGLIAEQVAEHFPELVQWFEGRIDNVRYDLLAVALLSVVKSQDARIASLEAAVKTLTPGYTPPAPVIAPQNTDCNNPPTVIPAPLPYTINPQ